MIKMCDSYKINKRKVKKYDKKLHKTKDIPRYGRSYS